MSLISPASVLASEVESGRRTTDYVTERPCKPHLQYILALGDLERQPAVVLSGCRHT
jgi:hypothetical protein